MATGKQIQAKLSPTRMDIQIRSVAADPNRDDPRPLPGVSRVLSHLEPGSVPQSHPPA